MSSSNPKISLTDSQRGAIRELGSRGAGGEFNQKTLGRLFVMGLVEVRSKDRRLVLTELGQAAYAQLLAGQ